MLCFNKYSHNRSSSALAFQSEVGYTIITITYADIKHP